jgi:cytochrome c biogenesis protein CcmG/thiol:disulfide interchange protein DsbE
MSNEQIQVAPARFKVIWLLPIAIIAVFLGVGLTRDPRYVPSPLIDRPVPVFDLPAVQGRTLGLSSSNLTGEVSLVNVFASWCVACRQEHPILMQLSKSKQILIHGLNYKDEQTDAAAWLDRFGDPYTRTGADIDGSVGIDWGVYGVPETFIIGTDGRIAYKHVGPIDDQLWQDKLLPVIRQLRSASTTQ